MFLPTAKWLADLLPKITLCYDALQEAGGRLNKSPHESNFVGAAAAAVIAVLGAPPRALPRRRTRCR